MSDDDELEAVTKRRLEAMMREAAGLSGVDRAGYRINGRCDGKRLCG